MAMPRPPKPVNSLQPAARPAGRGIVYPRRIPDHLRAARMCTGVTDSQLVMIAEILACADPDPQRRREHRLAKLWTFPADDQPVLRAAFNQVLKVRAA